ncbi:transposase [Streptomyces sp. NPDC007901]|uniref:transposase n=1 Tax=Streptomyces sp. NPDC007901 TaxID=3364785 RepID=UPI0036ED22F3
MASRKRIYAEFREGAVRIVTETGKPVPEVAEDLGVRPGTLHSWVSRARRNGSPSIRPTGRGRPARTGRPRSTRWPSGTTFSASTTSTGVLAARSLHGPSPTS